MGEIENTVVTPAIAGVIYESVSNSEAFPRRRHFAHANANYRKRERNTKS
jgi:hypothetical protein